MKKTERRPPLRHIREIIFTDGITLEVFRYPLNENGSHIKKMSRAKRTNYSGQKKKTEIIKKTESGETVETTENSDNYESTQTEESSSPILEIEEKKIYPFEINFNDQLKLPQISIDDTEPIQLSIDPEILKNFQESTVNIITDSDFMIEKIDLADNNHQNDFIDLKIL